MKGEFFDHGERGFGIRNFQLILPSVICSSHIASRIAKEVGAKSFLHQHGCGIIGEDVEVINQLFLAMAKHPNISSVLVVGLGCETIQSRELVARMDIEGQSVKFLVIQDSGGVDQTVELGVKAARELQDQTHPKSADEAAIVIGIDISRDYEVKELKLALEKIGFSVEVTDSGLNSADNLVELMHRGVHLAISFADPQQPPAGFPLFPVLNIASESPLHKAIAGEFDLSSSFSMTDLETLIMQTLQGEEAKTEVRNLGEIRAPRMVRSV